jgi:MFS family permease
MSAFYKDVLTVFGLFLLCSVKFTQIAGNLNNWGQICPYIASYFYHIDSQIRVSDLMMEAPISYIAEAIATLISGNLVKIVSPYWIIVIWVSSNSVVLFLSSFVTNAYFFVWVYGIGIGLMSGGIFLPIVWILWNNIPSRKGLTTGIILFGYTFGSIPSGLIFTFLANPSNESAENIGDEDEKMFSEDVAGRVPMTIRWSVLIYSIVLTIGLFFTPRKWDSSQSGQSESTLSFRFMIKSLKCWNLFFMTFFGMLAYFYIMFLYKILGMIYINDDYFISYVGSISFFVAAFARVLFGILLDKYSWKLVLGIVYALLVLMYSSFEVCLKSKALFAFYVIMISFFTSPVYLSLLIISERVFPKDKWIFTYISLAFVFDLGFIYTSEAFVVPAIGPENMFYIVGALTAIVFFQTIFFKHEAIIGKSQTKTEEELLVT